MTLYLDLDGPLLDVARRYHGAYRSVVEQLGCVPVELDTYWRLKRARRKETEICRALHPTIDPAAYLDLFLARIEGPSLLAEDTVVEGAVETLSALRSHHRLVLATLRRKGDLLRDQIRSLGLKEMFDDFLQREDNDGSWRNKACMVMEAKRFSRQESLLVGDTEGDLQAASLVGIPGAAVCNGLRSREVLAKYAPHHLMETIRDLPSIVPLSGGRPEMGIAEGRPEGR